MEALCFQPMPQGRSNTWCKHPGFARLQFDGAALLQALQLGPGEVDYLDHMG